MFKKIICIGIAAIAIAGLVLADGGHGHGGHGISLPNIPFPTISINTAGLLGLLRSPPIPIVKIPFPSHIPIPPIPVISLPISHGGGHGGHGFPELPIGDILSSILGGGGDSWGSWD